MAHFARLDSDNVVQHVIVVHNNELLDENGQESEAKGIAFCQNLLGGTWIQTSYTNSIRKNYAGVGYTYDAQRDAFIPPKIYASWVLDEETCRWEPPFQFPDDGKLYRWDESQQNWVEVTA